MKLNCSLQSWFGIDVLHIGDVVEKKNALRVQAKYLTVRLSTCLQHNKQLLDESESPMEELRAQISALSNESILYA